MSKIRVQILARSRLTWSSGHVPNGLPLERVYTLIECLGSEVPQFDAIIDTGSTLSIFPYHVWRQFENNISWLPDPLDEESKRPVCMILGATGGIERVRHGKIAIRYVNYGRSESGHRTESEPFTIIGRFILAKESVVKTTIIGIDGGSLVGRRLILNYPKSEGFIEDFEAK